MTVEDLFSLQTDMNRSVNKARSLRIELAEHEACNFYKSLEIKEAPGGTGAKNFLEWYTERKEELEANIKFYDKKAQKCREEIDEYIAQAPYPECDIIRYKIINNLSWNEIGAFVKYSGKQTKRVFWDYVKDVPNVPNVQPESVI